MFGASPNNIRWHAGSVDVPGDAGNVKAGWFEVRGWRWKPTSWWRAAHAGSQCGVCLDSSFFRMNLVGAQKWTWSRMGHEIKHSAMAIPDNQDPGWLLKSLLCATREWSATGSFHELPTKIALCEICAILSSRPSGSRYPRSAYPLDLLKTGQDPWRNRVVIQWYYIWEGQARKSPNPITRMEWQETTIQGSYVLYLDWVQVLPLGNKDLIPQSIPK